MSCEECGKCWKINCNKITENVKDMGSSIMYMEKDQNFPPYAYSIGFFENFQHPEIIMFGLPKEKCYRTFERIYQLLLESDEVMVPFECNYDIIQNDLPVLFTDISFSAAYKYMEYANWFYKEKTLIYPVLQLIWPDEKGYFPWQVSFNTDFIGHQPILHLS